MSRGTMRFRPFTIEQDGDATPEYEAECVTGTEADCGQRSAPWITPHPVEVWMAAHTAETGHTRYRRTFTDFATTAAGSGAAG